MGPTKKKRELHPNPLKEGLVKEGLVPNYLQSEDFQSSRKLRSIPIPSLHLLSSLLTEAYHHNLTRSWEGKQCQKGWDALPRTSKVKCHPHKSQLFI